MTLPQLLGLRHRRYSARSARRNSGSIRPQGSTYRSKVRVPRLDGKKMGVLATRSPHRPVPLGLSLVKVEVRVVCVSAHVPPSLSSIASTVRCRVSHHVTHASAGELGRCLSRRRSVHGAYIRPCIDESARDSIHLGVAVLVKHMDPQHVQRAEHVNSEQKGSGESYTLERQLLQCVWARSRALKQGMRVPWFDEGSHISVFESQRFKCHLNVH